jgi:multiple sugar transport system substrate-binding protein
MSAPVVLRGITWDHSRALPPLVATAQRFQELHPGVAITWAKRSLHDFGHAALGPLAAQYDLLVIDHPMMGETWRSGVLLNLETRLPQHFLAGLAAESIGQSYQSYVFEGRLFALPIDVAAPTASYRPDLLRRLGASVPQTWEDVLHLARQGRVVMPGLHADLFLNFLGLCFSCGSPVPRDAEQLVEREIGVHCLAALRELAVNIQPEAFGWNPIRLYEELAEGDRFVYCPFAFSYSNYSREGFARHLVFFTNPVGLEGEKPLRTVLGGTGLAISQQCRNPEIALEYAAYLAGPVCQRTLYGLAGGQPAHRSAWKDELLNKVTGEFFLNTLKCMESAFVRPRYDGYVSFQEWAGHPIADYLRGEITAETALESIDTQYRQSLSGSERTVGNG